MNLLTFFGVFFFNFSASIKLYFLYDVIYYYHHIRVSIWMKLHVCTCLHFFHFTYSKYWCFKYPPWHQMSLIEPDFLSLFSMYVYISNVYLLFKSPQICHLKQIKTCMYHMYGISMSVSKRLCPFIMATTTTQLRHKFPVFHDCR
jgi:hypothetical protein